jgi:hypothetical protein
MSDEPDTLRSLEQALADIRAKYDRTPKSALRTRRDLARMIMELEAEIALRRARAADR